MIRRLAFLGILYFSLLNLQGQSTNVNCSTAVEIDDPKNYCSGATEFDSEDVGDSGVPTPDCWTASNNDLWFTFVAEAKSVKIVVNGEEGTMNNPEIAIYRGTSCNSLIDINSCEINSSILHITSLDNFNLGIGERYFIRVDGRSNGDDGSFELCVNNYNPPASPGQDCNTASLLCNKDPFTVFNVTGEGFIENEADGTCLDIGSNGSENRSIWFKWTCGVSGTFTFDLMPISPEDDYDFGIFELPDGINSCNKNLIRCGATDGGDGMVCGPNTGLDLTSTDTEEDQNCNTGEDGYLRFIDMVAGQSYLMLINNFSDSELGFDISFGGTAEFEGPEVDFEYEVDASDPCDANIVVTDNSVPGVDGISEINWEFGEEANPSTASGSGPISVAYPDFGEKFITLQIISDGGCIVYRDTMIFLDECSYVDVLSLDVLDLQGVGCGETGTGRLELAPSISCGTYMYGLDGVFTSDPTFENLSAGDITISIVDENGCTVDSFYTIPQVADFSVDAGDDVTLSDPTMGIQLDAMSTAVGDVTISWSPSSGVTCMDGSTNCYNPQIDITEETTFTVTVVDANGCMSSDEVTVSVDLCGSSTISLSVDSLRNETCAGLATGYIEVSGQDGLPDYEYSIDDGPFGSANVFDNLAAGDYIVNVRDQNGCIFGQPIMIMDVPDFTLDAGDDITLDLPGDEANPTASTSLSQDFEVMWTPSTGVMCPDGSTNCLDPTINVSTTTTFTITIRSDDGCVKTDDLTVIVPDVCANSNLSIVLDSLSGSYCDGSVQSFLAISGSDGFPDYLYSINGGSFESDSIFIGLEAGNYTIAIQDRFNCTQTLDVSIADEPPFLVDAGADLVINGTEPFENLNGSQASANDVTVSWSPAVGIICPDSSTLDCLNPLVNPEITTTYTMTVTDALGCVVEDQVTVSVIRNEEVFAPNIFSPNEDGINDFFTIQADPDIVELVEQLLVFDRWGNKVYEARNLSPADPTTGWDGMANGSRAEQGVYVWFAEIKFFPLDPSNPQLSTDQKTVSGDVTLIR